MQIDRDATQMPGIKALALDNIILLRLQRQYLYSTQQRGQSKALNLDKDLSQAVKDVESRIVAKMKVLSIDRESKIKNKVSIKSTASSIISAYKDELERFTPEMLQSFKIEEDKALAENAATLEAVYFPKAAELEYEKDDDGEIIHIKPPSLESIIRTSGAEI